LVFGAVGFAEAEAEEMTVEDVKLQAAKANGGGHGAKDQFPVGMRVLAVDDDPTCLKLLEKLLQHCQYHGMPCSSRSSVSSSSPASGFLLLSSDHVLISLLTAVLFLPLLSTIRLFAA
jgi:hypothetical protein